MARNHDRLSSALTTNQRREEVGAVPFSIFASNVTARRSGRGPSCCSTNLEPRLQKMSGALPHPVVEWQKDQPENTGGNPNAANSFGSRNAVSAVICPCSNVSTWMPLAANSTASAVARA